MVAEALNTTTQSNQEPFTIITVSKDMLNVLCMARRVAGSTATVLIQGESGTGKEVLARYIHHLSGRAALPFVAMNCAALPEHLAESELFGYEKGAFTGAVQARKGKFELAHRSTLLLDEVSEMPLALQAKLLRVLQEKEVDPIGGRLPVSIDVRVIATTNRDLKQMVLDAEFRQDLYYRLRVIPITIPPLRSRKEDIPLLAEFFIQRFASQPQAALPRFNSRAMEQMVAYDWPGNVRELENTVERAMLLREGADIGPEFLFLDKDMSSAGLAEKSSLVGMTVREMEQRLIGQTLKHVNHNRTYAAQMLGISIRTLRNKLKEYMDQEGPVATPGLGK